MTILGAQLLVVCWTLFTIIKLDKLFSILLPVALQWRLLAQRRPSNNPLLANAHTNIMVIRLCRHATFNMSMHSVNYHAHCVVEDPALVTLLKRWLTAAYTGRCLWYLMTEWNGYFDPLSVMRSLGLNRNWFTIRHLSLLNTTMHLSIRTKN